MSSPSCFENEAEGLTSVRCEEKKVRSEGDVQALDSTTPNSQVEEADTSSIGKWRKIPNKVYKNNDPYNLNNYLRKHITGKNETNLPKVLTELFTPLKCNLCNCSMGSAVTANDHYEGKKHLSNIKKWLLGHPEFSDILSLAGADQSDVFELEQPHCKFCNLFFSSEQQAESHFLGRKHQNKLNNECKTQCYIDQFSPQWETLKAADNIRNNFLMVDTVNERRGRDFCNQKYICEICQISCPSKITFKDHLAGAKHKKKKNYINSLEPSSVKKDNILDDVLKSSKKFPSPADLSIYRTPSGKYYCCSCNLSIKSPVQFLQHSESKKHKLKSYSHGSAKWNKL